MEHGFPAEFRVPEVHRARKEPAGARSASLLRLLLLGLLASAILVLAVPVSVTLWKSWTGDYRFSHGPPLLAGVVYLLWQARVLLRRKDDCLRPGRWLLSGSTLMAAGAQVLDLPTLLPPAWLGMLLGTLGVLRGSSALRAAAPAAGLLLFALPWPTPVLKGVTAAAQDLSLVLTPLLAPFAGMQVERAGTLLTTSFEGGSAPYSVIVGPGCAGMKYLLALLSVAYFTAVLHRMGAGPTAAYVTAAVPLALAANSLRILLILAAGAAYGSLAGDWAHRHLGLVAFFLPCAVLALCAGRLAPPTSRGTSAGKERGVCHETASNSIRKSSGKI